MFIVLQHRDSSEDDGGQAEPTIVLARPLVGLHCKLFWEARVLPG